MAYFPMFVELEGRPCLIVGGGAVALRKARKLLPYGPCLTVVAQSFVPELEALEGAALCRRHFAPGTWRDRRWWSPRRATAR